MSTRADAPAAPGSTGDPIAAVKAVTGLVRARALYPDGHPMVRQSVDAVQALFAGWLADQPVVRIDVVDGVAHFDQQPARLDTQAQAVIVSDFVALGLDSVHVLRGVTPDEWLSLAARLAGAAASGHAPAPAPGDAQEPHISIGRLLRLDTRWQTSPLPEAPTGPVDPDYAESLRQADQAFGSFAEGRRPDTGAVRGLLQLLIGKVARSHAALAQILAVKQYENHTYCHSVNVSILSLLLGRQIGLDEDVIAVLVEGALLHDVGKTRIPVEIIKKPGALTKRERAVIERHPTIGAAMLVGTPGLGPLTPTLALEHHRHFRGGGYPDLGAQVPHLLSQIVAVADIYEAMTGARSYRPPALPEQASLVLARLSGQNLNPALVRAFVAAINFFPVGTLVTTTLGQTGIVTRSSPSDPLHPVIELVDPHHPGRRLGIEVDTAARDESGAYVCHVAGTREAAVA